MRAHLLQHVPFEGLGSIHSWLETHGANLTSTRFFEYTSLPSIDEIDLLIVLGGPMSVNDEGLYPWLAKEKRFISEMIGGQKAVLGICLGAQLIAAALGSRVYPNKQREIGWFPIQSVLPLEQTKAFRFPKQCVVFHWHGETFDLPPGAIHLAASETCRNQAFQMGFRVIGLQFHLEMTPQNVKEIVKHCHQELVPDEFVQSEERILSASTNEYAETNSLMADILSFLVEQRD